MPAMAAGAAAAAATSRGGGGRASTVFLPVGEASVQRAKYQKKMKAEALNRDINAASLIAQNAELPKLSGQMKVFTCGWFSCSEVPRWLILDPGLGVLMLWVNRPPDELELDEDMLLAPSKQCFCIDSSSRIKDLLEYYKLFDLVDIDVNRNFRNIFVQFQRPFRSLVLTTDSDEDFMSWLDALCQYSPGNKSAEQVAGKVLWLEADAANHLSQFSASASELAAGDASKPDEAVATQGKGRKMLAFPKIAFSFKRKKQKDGNGEGAPGAGAPGDLPPQDEMYAGDEHTIL